MLHLNESCLEQIAQRYLGSEASVEDAEQFATYCESRGWDWEDNFGEITFVRDGEAMSEGEWQNALAECFKIQTLKEVSLEQIVKEATPRVGEMLAEGVTTLGKCQG